MKRFLFLFISLFFLAGQAQAQVLQLITEAEASLPAAKEGGEPAETRAITRSPGVDLASAEAVTGAGFPLRIVFAPRGGIAIDLESVRVVYLKSPPVDLTGRLKSQITPTGVEVPAASAPPGEHPLQITVRDKEGRQTVKKILLVVR